jgi:hypothetical protein
MCSLPLTAYASDVKKIEPGYVVEIPGYWISGEALHELHQEYKIEKAKREACEQVLDIAERMDAIYQVATVAQDHGVHWSWWITWGATTFTAGMILGFTFRD